MTRARARTRTFRHARRRRQDEVIGGKIEALDEMREKGKKAPVAASDSRDFLERAREDPSIFDRRGNRARHMHQREEISLRKERADLFEDFLSSAHSGQPIVDECHTHLTIPRSPETLPHT